ncbi:MAG: GAF domain-containing protein [Anaerolineae bacterium]|nr:GAF domain-containing protein [Anaerolineae bacterium]
MATGTAPALGTGTAPSQGRKTRRPRSIQTQLLLGTGVILALAVVIALTGYFSLRQLQAGVQTTLQEASQIRDASLGIENSFLLARQDEASFVANWPSMGYEAAYDQYALSNAVRLRQAQTELDRMSSLVATARDQELRSLTAEAEELAPLLDSYEAAFLATVAKVEQRTRGGGLDAAMRGELDGLEAMVEPLARPEFRALLLEIRAAERGYAATGRQEYVDEVRLLVDRFVGLVEGSDAADLETDAGASVAAADLTGSIEAYLAQFTRLVNVDRDIKVNTGIFREVTADIGDMTAAIRQKSEAGLARAQDQLRRIGQQSTIALAATAVLALGLGVLAAVMVARRIAGPLGELSQAAQRMGSGDLTQPIKAGGAAEVVTLAQAFGAMADRLRELIGSLEDRVTERTRSLEAAAEVSRATTLLRDPDELLRQVVDLVQERFNLYYVGLFLVEPLSPAASPQPGISVGPARGGDLREAGGTGEARQWAALRAGTGEAGATMIAQGHRLSVAGESMIGRCVAEDRARIALDVGQEPVRFDNPLLPQTRSEMALPLHSRGQVIGAMTVQSTVEAAFDEADIAVMQTMADQVAVAIDNARLFVETQAALKEMEAVHRQYLREAWTGYAPTAGATYYETAPSRQKQPGLSPGDGGGQTLAAPITLRGEEIGTVGIEVDTEARQWTAEEAALVRAVTDRLALAAENLRLLDETQRRAAEERLVGEVTAQMRQTLDLDAILQAAAREMRGVLDLDEVEVRMGRA